jgi:hypothetical protein
MSGLGVDLWPVIDIHTRRIFHGLMYSLYRPLIAFIFIDIFQFILPFPLDFASQLILSFGFFKLLIFLINLVDINTLDPSLLLDEVEVETSTLATCDLGQAFLAATHHGLVTQKVLLALWKWPTILALSVRQAANTWID